MVGQPYTQAFTSVRGTPPVSYALGTATAAPPGLTLTPAGVLSGTPTESGVFGFTVVATDAAALSDQQPFTLQAYGQPVVAGVSPASGPLAGGVTVIVTGSGFTGATKVTFGGSPPVTRLDVLSDTQLTVTSPAQLNPGAVDVTVTTPGGTSATSAADQFTYLPVPVVTGVSPATGLLAGGASVTVTGSGFTGATRVTFGSMAATSPDVLSDTQLTVTSPAQLYRGWVDVTVTTPGGTSATSAADQFTYLPVPVVEGLSPAIGPLAGGVTVTVFGSGFTGATEVTFGGAPPVTRLDVLSDTQLTVTSPAQLNPGAVDVRVTTPGGTSVTSAADQFTYPAVPVVEGLSPASGPLAGGVNVRVTGSGFTGATKVTLGGAPPVTSLDVLSDIALIVTSPPANTSGTVDVTVTGPSGTSATSPADQFTYGN